MDKKIIIAVDGYSSCGKSTLAKDLAKELNYIYIDSGAMYRAVTLYLIQNEIDIEDTEAVITSLPNIKIEFRTDEVLGRNETYLNGRNVEEQIRRPIVSQSVSELSEIKEVRAFLVEQQKNMGLERGLVMDGRDIGTVVFKDAEFKLFVTADIETRAERRYKELSRKGIATTLEEVKANLDHRDYIDTHRDESPLYQSDDAVLLDNTILSVDQQLKLVLNMARNIIADLNKGSQKSNEKNIEAEREVENEIENEDTAKN